MLFKKTAFYVLGVLASLAILGGCTSKQDGSEDPKQRLNDYISQSFAVKSVQDKGALAGFLTGDAKARLERWSDDQFSDAFIKSKHQFLKLAFKESKPVSPDEVNITYEITFQSNYPAEGGAAQDAKVTSRKLAQMVRQNGKWYIADVKNVRELVEYKSELSVQPGPGH